jgi:two-component system, cell cycle sensor histidine kinase and response regulator CckA
VVSYTGYSEDHLAVSSFSLEVRPASVFRVLLVEDDPSFVQFLRDSLPALAAELKLTVATRLSVAIEALSTGSFDAVLLDLNLPDSSGLATLQQLTSIDARVPVVVLTGIEDARLAREAVRLGAQDWLTKGSPDPEVVVRALRYATERKRLTDGLIRSQKLEAIGQLARNVAHEFNNLLTTILGNAALASTSDEPGLREIALGEIEQAAQRGALLTRQLLGLARPRMAALALADVKQATTTVHDLCLAVLPRNVALHLIVPETRWVPLAQDQLEQVLLNLVLNARDAMPQGGTITIAAARSSALIDDERRRAPGPAAASSQRVQIQVSDTGTGIHPDALPHVFEPFFTTKGAAGTGLGLMIAKELIEHAGGTIRVESTYGEGSRVLIDLPQSG